MFTHGERSPALFARPNETLLRLPERDVVDFIAFSLDRINLGTSGKIYGPTNREKRILFARNSRLRNSVYYRCYSNNFIAQLRESTHLVEYRARFDHCHGTLLSFGRYSPCLKFTVRSSIFGKLRDFHRGQWQQITRAEHGPAGRRFRTRSLSEILERRQILGPDRTRPVNSPVLCLGNEGISLLESIRATRFLKRFAMFLFRA